ncbi:MAG: hypothetical protein NTY53_17630 [Kiritimatiellaeota bacterium]|nr:hypothetical protein [Kiritimatiellota bacterium]
MGVLNERNLAQAQLDEVQADDDYRAALIRLYRLDGALLRRRHLDASGAEPVAQKAV